jgi:triacylglycerol lipase
MAGVRPAILRTGSARKTILRQITWNDVLRPGEDREFFTREPLPAFDPTTSEYSVANAYWLAELSRLVYKRDSVGPTSRAQFLANVHLEELRYFDSDVTGAGAYLVRKRAPLAFAVLAFRGTEQKAQDLLHDADARLVPAFGESVRVHNGFKRALNSLWTDIAAALSQLDCPLFFTGHSLGAALAVLATLRHPPRAVYTFGSPRVGDRRLAEKLRDAAIHRIVYGEDAIAAVPLELFGFRHVGKEQRIGRSRGLPVRSAVLEWDAWAVPPRSLADHAPINYVNALR